MDLGDHDNAVRVTSLHIIAGIDLTQADLAGDRRDDAAIGQVQLLRIDQRLVGLHRREVLLGSRDLRIDGLARDRVLRQQRSIALQIHLRIF